MHQSIQIPAQTASTTVSTQPNPLPTQLQTSPSSDQKPDGQKQDEQKPNCQKMNALEIDALEIDAPAQDSQPQRLQSCAQLLERPTLQQDQSLSASLHQHSQRLDQLGEQSLSSWYRCRESAGLTRQRAFAAVDQATTVDAEIAQLNRTIQRQLQQFDAQLKISTQTLQQEVDQKVGQYRRHVQQQSKQFCDRLRLSQAQSHPAIPQLTPTQKLFQSITLR